MQSIFPEDPLYINLISQIAALNSHTHNGTDSLQLYPKWFHGIPIASTVPTNMKLTEAGLKFSGTSPDHSLMEIAELPREVHPFMLGTQFHPEFLSRPLSGHPLFLEFIKAATKNTA